MVSLLSLLAIISPAFAAVHESLGALPYGWTESSYALSGDTILQLQVAL